MGLKTKAMLKDREYWLNALEKLRQNKSIIIEDLAMRCFGQQRPTTETEGFLETQYLAIYVGFKKWIEENHPAHAVV